MPDDGPNDPPIEPVYPIEYLIGLLTGTGVAMKVAREILKGTEEPAPTQPKPQEKPPEKPLEKPPTGKEPPPGGRKLEWELSKNKSELRWENQMKNRDWTKERIDDTVKNGKEYPAPNKPNPEHGATRYEKDGKFVVRDDKTGEILQVSGPRFIPEDLP